MTAVDAVARRQPRHARHRFERLHVLVSIRIPKAVDAVADWAQGDPLVAGLVALSSLGLIAGLLVSPMAGRLLWGLGGVVVGVCAMAVWHRLVTASQRHRIAELEATVKGLTTKAVPPVADDGPTARMSIRDLLGGGR